MKDRIVYKLFGIPVWSVERETNKEAIYEELSKRFADEMAAALATARKAL